MDAVHQQIVEVFSQRRVGFLYYQGSLCVTNVDGLRERILAEAHSSKYLIHPGATKMYLNL